MGKLFIDVVRSDVDEIHGFFFGEVKHYSILPNHGKSPIIFILAVKFVGIKTRVKGISFKNFFFFFRFVFYSFGKFFIQLPEVGCNTDNHVARLIQVSEGFNDF